MRRVIGLVLFLCALCVAGEYTVKEIDCALYNDVWETTQDATITINVDTELKVLAMYLPDFGGRSVLILMGDSVAQRIVAAADKYVEWRTKAINMGNVEVNKPIATLNIFGAVKQFDDSWEGGLLDLTLVFFTASSEYFFVMQGGDEGEPCILSMSNVMDLKKALSPASIALLLKQADQKQNIEDEFN